MNVEPYSVELGFWATLVKSLIALTNPQTLTHRSNHPINATQYL